MTAVTGLYWALGLVLVVAGAAKLRRPAAATLPHRLARIVPSRARVGLTRAAGATELAVGLAAVLLDSRWVAALVAATYVVLAGTAVLLLRTAPGTDCGCFGDTASPLGPGHVAVDLLGAAIAVVAAATGSVALPTALADSPVAAVLTAALAAAAAGTVVLMLTALPDLTRVRRRAETAGP